MILFDTQDLYLILLLATVYPILMRAQLRLASPGPVNSRGTNYVPLKRFAFDTPA